MMRRSPHVRLLAIACLAAAAARADAPGGEEGKEKVKAAIPVRAMAFPLERVRLLDGPFRHAMELDRDYILSLDVDPLPGGMPRAVTARLEVRDRDGRVRPETVGYNAPLSLGAGARLALLGDFGRVRVARPASGADGCALAEGQSCALAGETVRLVGLGASPSGAAAALVSARGPSGVEEARWLGRDGELVLAGGRPLQLEAVALEPGVLLRVREAPGNPWALAAAVVLAAGVALMWRKLAR
jgi:hypothetical protein